MEDRFLYQGLADPTAWVLASTPELDRWWQPLAEPVREIEPVEPGWLADPAFCVIAEQDTELGDWFVRMNEPVLPLDPETETLFAFLFTAAIPVPDSIFATNITITLPQAVSVSISLPQAINVSIPDDE